MSKNRVLFILIFTIFVFSAAAGYFWGSRLMNSPDIKPAAVLQPETNFFNPKVTSDTVLIRDREYLCGDLGERSETMAPDDLLDLDREALAKRFPSQERWSVSFANEKYLTITSKVYEFCPVHKAYRHFGIYQGRLAVYEGPLDYNTKVLKVESVPVESLNPEFRIMLEQAMDLGMQARSVAEKLRGEMEFQSDEAINAALDNIDELR